MPMARISGWIFGSGVAVLESESIAEITAERPVAASPFATIGTRVRLIISPP